MDDVRVEYLALSELLERQHPRNPKDHSIDSIVRSIERFGYVTPGVIDERTGYFAEGHGRTKALAWMKRQGKQPPARVEKRDDDWYVPVYRGVVFNSDSELEAFLVASNRLTELGGWDEPELVALLQDLAAEDEELLRATGYDGDDLQAMLDELGGAFDEPAEDKGAQIDRAAELQAQWQTERGQLWIIPSKTAKGEHRLLCGDSTNADDVARVMAGERARLVFTDPPYGVDYDGGTKLRDKLENDEIGTDIYERFLRVLPCDDDTPLYMWFAHSKSEPVYAALRVAGWQIRNVIIWNKNQAQFGALSAQYKEKKEPLIYAHRKGCAPAWYGPTNEVTVWDCARAASNDLHPTQKPPELAARAINNSSRRGDVVFEAFGGSGSTMVGCEETGRHCYAIEIEPKYCAVILQRMADMGLEPRLAD